MDPQRFLKILLLIGFYQIFLYYLRLSYPAALRLLCNTFLILKFLINNLFFKKLKMLLYKIKMH